MNRPDKDRGSERVMAAYRHCQAVARAHYENFPVASFALPRRLRRPVAVIYTFARAADDIADEGDAPAHDRLAALDAYAAHLDDVVHGKTVDEPVFIALADVIARHRLPVVPFHDLLDAFRQDAVKTRYADFSELLEYCRRSANPIGRLLLALYGIDTPEAQAESDDVCTALQLINFLQDLRQDLVENNRIYLPQADMTALGVTDAQLHSMRNDDALRELVTLQSSRARERLTRGAALARRVPPRFALELRLTVQGGLRVLKRLDGADDVFCRPRLGLFDWAGIVLRALLYPSPHAPNPRAQGYSSH